MTMTAELATTIDATSIRLMTADEARACVVRIHAGLENVRVLLAELHDRAGWRALGYESWALCAQSEFGISRSRAFQLLDAARIDAVLQSTIVDSDAPVPESHARELAPLKGDPEAVRRVYAEVRDVTDGRPTQKDVRAGVDKHLARPPRPAPKPSVVKSAAPEAEVSQDIPDELATAGADVDPAHEFPFNNEAPLHAAKAEQWCQACGSHYRGAACPCASDLATSIEDRKEEPAPPASSPGTALPAPPRRSAISDPVPARRTGADGGAMVFVESKAGPLTRALFSHATLVETAQAISEEAPPAQYVALVGLLAERLSIEQVRALYRTLDTRIRLHNDRQTVLHASGRAS